jgi:hypothetical protein
VKKSVVCKRPIETDEVDAGVVRLAEPTSRLE